MEEIVNQFSQFSVGELKDLRRLVDREIKNRVPPRRYRPNYEKLSRGFHIFDFFQRNLPQWKTDILLQFEKEIQGDMEGFVTKTIPTGEIEGIKSNVGMERLVRQYAEQELTRRFSEKEDEIKSDLSSTIKTVYDQDTGRYRAEYV